MTTDTTAPRFRLEFTDQITAYVAERPFITAHIRILIGDGKTPAAIVGWLNADIAADGGSSNVRALLLWLEQKHPELWSKPAPAIEYVDIA